MSNDFYDEIWGFDAATTDTIMMYEPPTKQEALSMNRLAEIIKELEEDVPNTGAPADQQETLTALGTIEEHSYEPQPEDEALSFLESPEPMTITSHEQPKSPVQIHFCYDDVAMKIMKDGETMVQLNADGSMEFGDDYDPDDTAWDFWMTMSRAFPGFVQQPEPMSELNKVVNKTARDLSRAIDKEVMEALLAEYEVNELDLQVEKTEVHIPSREVPLPTREVRPLKATWELETRQETLGLPTEAELAAILEDATKIIREDDYERAMKVIE